MNLRFTYEDIIAKEKRDSKGKSISEYSSDELVNLGYEYYSGYDGPIDYEKALKYFKMAADMNDSWGHAYLADCAINGYGMQKDYELALKHATISAEQGICFAKCILGHLYYIGEAVQEDKERAFELFLECAEKNIIRAVANVGIMLAEGIGCKKDFARAVKYFERAAEHGDDQSMYIMGLHYANGDGVPVDLDKANLWLTRAAAIYAVATSMGETYKNDAEKTLEYVRRKLLEKATAAGKGSFYGFTPCGGAEYDMHRHDFFYSELHKHALDDPFVNGEMKDTRGDDRYSLYCRSVLIRREALVNGKGIDEKRFREAISLLSRSSDMGCGNATLALAAIYKSYPTYVDGYDYSRADEYVPSLIKLAAEQGSADAEYAYGYLLDSGLGVEKNHAEAIYHYYVSSRGRSINGMTAWYVLTDEDKKRAIGTFLERELERVIERGDVNDLLLFAKMSVSEDMKKDYEAASRLLSRARALGSVEAGYLLAECHYAMHDYPAATKAMLEAARCGHARAGYEVAYHLAHSAPPTGSKVYLDGVTLAGTNIAETEIIKMLESAFNAGITDAAYELGAFLKRLRRFDAALTWLGKALELGIREAEYDIGSIYYREFNDAERAKPHLEAASDFNAYAAYDLAEILHHAEKDYPRAKEYYERAHSLLAARSGGSDYPMQQIDARLDDYRRNECPSCHAYYSGTEKRGLFGTKTVCSRCGGKLPH